MSIKINGLDLLANRFDNIMAKTDPDKIALRIGAMIYNATQEAFEFEKSPFGKRWDPLKPSTIARKKRNKDKILWESGKLRSSQYLSQKDTGEVEVGVNAAANKAFYPVYHQFGAKHTPKRQFLPINKRGRIPKRIEIEISDYLTTLAKDL